MVLTSTERNRARSDRMLKLKLKKRTTSDFLSEAEWADVKWYVKCVVRRR